MSISQFVNESQKAVLHFSTEHCKQIATKQDGWKTDIEIFCLQHVLSLMIYCNFDKLQFEFSKTFRENDGRDHDNFFHLGMYLKQGVHEFGHELTERFTKFYHGVDEQLFFPKFKSSMYGSNTVDILCPLSTTKSYEVAVNFANNRGLVVQFSCTG
eukprot:877915_1